MDLNPAVLFRSSGETPTPFRWRGRSGLIALAVVLLGGVLTLVSWGYARRVHARELRDYFEYRSRDAVTRIEARLQAYEQVLMGAHGLIRGGEPVSRARFAAFVEDFRLDQRFPGIQGVGYAVPVPPAARARHEAQVRAQGFPGYRITPEGAREVYTAIVFLEPFQGRNLRAFGYDMFSEPVRREAMTRARDLGRTAMSGKVTLVQEAGSDIQAGFLVYVPVYRFGSALGTPEDRRRNLQGWVYAPFRMGDLMRGVLGEGAGDLLLAIYDGPPAAPAALMSGQAPGPAGPATFRGTFALTFGGRTWSIVSEGSPSLARRHGFDPSASILGLGILASLLLGLLALLATGRIEEAEAAQALLEGRVAARTRELQTHRWRLESILEGTGVGTWAWNVRTGELVVNELWARLLGYTLEELSPISIKTWEDLAHPEDLAMSGSLLRRHFAGELPAYECECRMKHKDGSWIWVQDRGRVKTWTAFGKPLMMFGTHTDITARKRSDARMQALAEELERKNHELEDTLYAASHDLRSPLLNVRGFSEGLSTTFDRLRERLASADVPLALRDDLEPLLEEDLRASLRFIRAGGERMDAIISGLLRVSRAGSQALHPEDVDMAALIIQVLGALAFQVQEAGATVEVGELPPCTGDAQALHRVFANLVDNALKYRHPDRAPRIRLAGRRAGDRCVYEVEDNGVGIDPRHEARIWKLFQRLDPSGPAAGEGLGLTLVQRLLHRLDGRVWVEAGPGPEGGSRFLVDLPAAAARA